MEFPGLGEQCNVHTCKQLDFLPFRCDSCSGTYCKDHFYYSSHNCPSAHLKDNQVPVCPLCQQPVPIARGQVPDIRMSQHMDTECTDDRAVKHKSRQENRIFTNKCNVKGCKQKELIPVLCSDCKVNYCLRHRHPQDHYCDPRKHRIPASATGAGFGAAGRAYAQSASAGLSALRTNAQRKITDMFAGNGNRGKGQQNQVTEDEALAQALHASLNGRPATGAVPKTQSKASTQQQQEEEDRLLAQAIAESERTAAAGVTATSNTSSSSRNADDKCCLS